MSFFSKAISAKGLGMGAIGGGIGGLLYSGIGGAFMGGDQSQVAGMGFGAAAGMAMFGGRNRLGNFMRNTVLQSGKHGMLTRGGVSGRRLAGYSALHAAGVGSAALIGSTILESNRGY